MSADREPTRDELLAMAYADGELPADARRELEERMAHEPALRREVAELRKLEVLARQVAPREPKDHEWDRLESGIVHPAGIGLGFLALFVGVLGITIWGGWELAVSDLELLPKILLFLILGGFVLLFLVVLRARLRTIPYDPYTEVKR